MLEASREVPLEGGCVPTLKAAQTADRMDGRSKW